MTIHLITGKIFSGRSTYIVDKIKKLKYKYIFVFSGCFSTEQLWLDITDNLFIFNTITQTWLDSFYKVNLPECAIILDDMKWSPVLLANIRHLMSCADIYVTDIYDTYDPSLNKHELNKISRLQYPLLSLYDEIYVTDHKNYDNVVKLRKNATYQDILNCF